MNSATSIGISLGELISVGVAIVAVLWMLGKINFNQFRSAIDLRFSMADAAAQQRFSAMESKVDARFATIDNKLKSFDTLHGELARVDKDLIQVRLEMATHYVRQEGIRQLQTRMEQLFTEVFDKLDGKQDKSACPPAGHHGGQ